MITRTVGLMLLACLALAASAAGNGPFVGDWKFNPSKSTPDKMTVQSDGGNKYTFDFGGGPETIVVDGTDQRTERYGGGTLSVAAEAGTWKIVRKGTNGHTMLSATWSVSGDGSTLTDRYSGFNGDGARFDVIYTYERKAAGSGFAGTWVSTSEEAVNFVLGLKIQPFEQDGLSIVDSTSQIMGNMNFAAPLVRKVDERTLELMRKKTDGAVSDFLQLRLSPDRKTLTITPHLAAGREPHVLAFDRR